MAKITQWNSRFGFLMAAAGFAVGLGNIWRFPYVTGENGGAAFVLVYLVCVLVIGVPILMGELMLGRHGGSSASGSMANIARAEGASASWRWVGGLNLLTAFLILMVYAVVAGWVLQYGLFALGDEFAGLEAATSVDVFDEMLTDFRGLLLFTVLGLGLTSTILYFGVTSGIERVVRILMPLLLVLLIGLAVVNVFSGEFARTLDYLFTPDFSKLNANTLLAALAQAFFSIGVAMAGMMTYGAYLPKKISIAGSAFAIVAVDTLVALLAGLVIFPLVFQFGLDPAGGVGLIFETLPVAFGSLPAGQWLGSLFFLLLAVAAITSMVGLMEPLVAWCEADLKLSRELGVVLIGTALWVCSTISILSYNRWSYWQFLERDLSEWLDFVPNEVFLPLGALLLALFAGWVVSAPVSRRELAVRGRLGYSLWLFLIRFVVPPAVLVILVAGLI